MQYYSVKELEQTGLVLTVMTGEGHGCWLSNNPDGHAGYREVAEHFGLDPDREMTGTFQRHSTTVMEVGLENAGQHVMWREPEPVPWDGIVTNQRRLMLTSIESDCTPVFLLDPVNKAIGLIHSGWKGTAGQISVNAVKLMQERYGSRPEEILAAFGPGICRDCYEVGGELKEPFSVSYSEEEIEQLFRPKANGKFLLDVNLAIRISLERIGLLPQNIIEASHCTYHEKLFYSHRRQLKDGLPGNSNMLTGIMLK